MDKKIIIIIIIIKLYNGDTLIVERCHQILMIVIHKKKPN